MPNPEARLTPSAELRRRAEKIVLEKIRAMDDNATVSPGEIQRIFHELQVQQIELEMQNEELRRAHGELDEVRARYFDLYEMAPVGYITLSPQGLIVEANLTAAMLVGMGRSSMIHRQFSLFVHKEDQDIFYLHSKQHCDIPEPRMCELRMVKQDGGVFWAQLTATAVQQSGGDAVECRMTINDITAWKQAEEARQQTEEKYRLLFDSANDAIFICDMQGRLREVNPMTCKRLGYTSAELKAMTIDQVDTVQEAQHIPERIQRIREHDDLTFETVHQRKDGTSIPVEVNAQKITWEGQPAILAIGRDITARKKMEKAEAANRAKGRFLANMSHEIRTPMNAILGMTHLAMESRERTQQQRLLENIKQSGESLLDILNDILDFSKIEAGQLQLDFRPFKLNQLLETIVSTMNVPATEKGLRLEAVTAPELPAAFHGDASRIKQILLNLVGNAIKFTPSGSITIAVKSGEGGQVEGKVPLHFSVTDTGIGIAPDKIEEIFNSFEQADSSYARQYGGVGLGLAISRQLASLMGGTLGVESSPNQGSVFHCILALSPWTGEVPDQSPSAEQYVGEQIKDLRILVVDDNALNRDVARMVLENDHRVTTAGNGVEALKALSQEIFDVVLMDVQMPQMDGLTTTAIIRALEKGLPVSRELPQDLLLALRKQLANTHVPIVAMTAHAMVGDRDMCLKAGMDSYITKPFQPAQLTGMFASLTAKHSPEEDREPCKSGESAASKATFARSPATLQQIRNHLQSSTGLPAGQIERLLLAARMSILENLATAAEALRLKEYTSLGRAAHTLKGTLLQCGLTELATRAEAIERGARADSNLPYEHLLAALHADLADLLANGPIHTAPL